MESTLLSPKIKHASEPPSSSFGIGRAIATLFAREGADVTIVHLPDEQADAEETKKAVEQEGKDCWLVAGNLMDNENCKMAVGKHVERYE